MIKPLILSVLLGAAVLPCSAAEVEIEIDGNDAGRIYEGRGAVSAGASSELLIDYPEPYRSDILDYLFKPKFGAAFQHLKVEFGGGENSTCGAEASHAITKEELANPKTRGYEFWLMKEARKRNPDIILEGLPWTFPWYCKANNKQHRQEKCDKCNRSPFMCKDATDKVFTDESADWLVAWIEVAKRDWDLDVDWLVAAMNESGTDKEWVKRVRQKLDAKGFTKVKIQGPDDNSGFWEIFDEFETDSEYDKIVEAVGYHYLNGYGAGQHVDTKFDYRDPSDKVKATGKPLWASEDWSFGGDWGPATYIVRGFNEMYANDRITKYLVWAGFDSIYKGVDYSNVGVITADQPWSGYYNVREGLWVVSHYTQFAEPG